MSDFHPLRDLPIERLRERTSVKWGWYGSDVLPLWVAEMDAHPIPAVVEAVDQAMRSGNSGYPTSVREYAESFACFAADRWTWTVPVDQAAMVADVMTGVSEAIALVSEPGDTVIVNPPVYPPFFGFIEHIGRLALQAPLGADGRLDLAAVEDAYRAAGRGAVHLLSNPHNPTSVVHTRKELADVAALAHEHGITVVVDEIHAPLVESGFVPYLTLDGTDDAIVVSSASKGFNLAGLKSAIMVGGQESRLPHLHEMVSHGPSHVAMIAHVAAFSQGSTWLDGLHADLAENRQQLADGVEKIPGVLWNQESGTYLAWLDLRALGLGDDPAAAILEQSGVALNSGLPFGAGGAGHARLNYATTPEILAEALGRLSSLA
ncbi:MAG: aminotransferase class I/II-fold pyridoxal phosphate-dependent enzyme [Aeromicrobium sp.]